MKTAGFILLGRCGGLHLQMIVGRIAAFPFGLVGLLVRK
jgi:hypothetical protein